MTQPNWLIFYIPRLALSNNSNRFLRNTLYMSVLIYAENAGGTFKKSIFEAVSYAKAIADQNNTSLTAISIGDVNASELASLGKYGAQKVLHVSGDKLKNFVNQAYASIIAEAAKKEGADTVV